jgi:two-component system chemotaxis response regulator CheB
VAAKRAEDRPNARDIVCIGASAGGVEALTRLVAPLPRDLAAALLVVLHVPARGSVLPDILRRAGDLPVAHADAGDPIERGRIYVAPPDLHLVVDNGAVALVRGPKENGHRPAIDPLFRSAARGYGSRVVGVVLSGALDDGSLGLADIKRAGGLTLVQDPDEALYPSMPARAIEHVRPDHVLSIEEIAALLARLSPSSDDEADGEEEPMDADVTQESPDEITAENEAEGTVSRFTCPECNGTLWELDDGGRVKLRCRVGHSFTEESYLVEHAHMLEAALWTALTALEEKADFCRRLAERLAHGGHEISAQRYREQSANAVDQTGLVRRALTNLLGAVPPVEESRGTS